MIKHHQLGFSMASLPNYSLEEALKLGSEMGFEAVELLAFVNQRHSIGILAGFDWETMTTEEKKRLGQQLSRFKLVSVHGPFMEVPLLSANAGIAKEARRQAAVALEATGALNGYSCTFHVNGRVYSGIHDYWDEAIDVFRRLGDIAAKAKTRVAIETGFPNTVDDYCGLIEAIDHEHVGSCVDIGHVFAYYDPALFGSAAGVVQHNNIMMAIVERMAAKLFCFHLHDIRAKDFCDHQAAGRGVIDYRRLLAFLNTTSFAGPMAVELDEPDVETALQESKRYVESFIN